MKVNNVYLLENPQTVPKLMRGKCEKIRDTKSYEYSATYEYLYKFALNNKIMRFDIDSLSNFCEII